MRFTIQWRFIAKLALALVVLAVAMHFTHRWQLRKQVGILLVHADQARDSATALEEQGNARAAAAEREREMSYLNRYLMARPDDLDARERVVLLMAKSIRSGKQLEQVYLVLEDLLRRDPSRDKLRRFTIDFLVVTPLHMYKEAAKHAQYLLDHEHANDGEIEGLLAYCNRMELQPKLLDAAGKILSKSLLSEKSNQDEIKEIVEFYKKSIEHRPDLLSSYLGLAFVYRSFLNDNNSADQQIQEMLANNGTNFRAFLNASDYWKNAGDNSLAESMLVEASHLAPDEIDTQLAIANLDRVRARRLWRTDKNLRGAINAQLDALRTLTRAREKHPKVLAVHLGLADLEEEAHGQAQAIATIRQGLTVLPQSRDLLYTLLEYQFQSRDAAGVTETVETLRQSGIGEHQLEFEQARLHFVKEEWLEAARAFQNVIPQLADKPELLRQAYWLLGRCYEQLGEKDLRLTALTHALPDDAGDRLWVPVMFGIADAQAALNQSEEALRTYRKLGDRVPIAMLSVARLETARASQSNPGKSSLEAAEAAVSQTEKALADHRLPDTADVDVKLLRIRLQIARGDIVKARASLEDLTRKSPKEIASWVELAMLDLTEKKPDVALKTLNEAAKETNAGDSVELRVARAKALIAAKETPAKILEQAAGIDKFPPAQQRKLLSSLFELTNGREEMNAVTTQLADTLAHAKPYDLSVQLMRFDQASRQQNAAAMEQALKQIVEIDGPEGQTTRLARAHLLLSRARSEKNTDLVKEALALLNSLEQKKVSGSKARLVALGQGLAYDMMANTDAALEKYQQVIALEDTNPKLGQRVVELLAAKGKSTEGVAVFKKLPPEIASLPAMQALLAEMMLKTRDNKQAIEAAVKAAEGSTDYRVWLRSAGIILAAEGDREKAKTMFRKAVELAPKKMETWLALMDFLMKSENKEAASDEFKKAQANFQKPELSVFLALGYAELDEVEKAIGAYSQARMEKPDDVRLNLAEAEYLLRAGKLVEAREGFKRVIDLSSATPAEKALARQRLALAMASDPDYTVSRSALDLLTKDASAEGNSSVARHRTQAMIYALQRDRESKLEAIRLLEENKKDLSPNEQFLLARLYLAVNNPGKVRLAMAELLEDPKNRIPLYLSFYSMWLLRQKDAKEAEVWIKELNKKAPDTLQTSDLNARLAAAKKELEKARSILNAEVQKRPKSLLVAASAFEQIGLYDDAERLFKQFVQENKEKEPGVQLLLANFYGLHGRTKDALKIWEETRDKLPSPQVAETVTRVLYVSTTPVAADLKKVADWLESAASKAQGADKAALLQCLATVRNLQGDYAGSEELYREVIAANPRDALAFNNLAYLLSAFQNRHDEALGMIEQARKLIGPHPVLIQTEAQIRLKKGEPEKALKLIEAALADSPNGSGYYTKARAEFDLKEELQAKIALEKALEFGLKPTDLHPLERPGYEEIKKKLNVKQNEAK